MRRLLLLIPLLALALFLFLRPADRASEMAASPRPPEKHRKAESAKPVAATQAARTAPTQKTTHEVRHSGNDKVISESARLIDHGKPEEARALLERKLQESPDDAELLSELALIQSRIFHDDRQARALFERSLKDHPENGEALAELVEVYSRQKALSEGATFLSTLITKHPEHENAYLALAEVLTIDGRAEEAVSYLERAAQLPGADTHTVDQMLASTYLQTGDADKAVAAYDRLLDAQRENGSSRSLEMARITALTAKEDFSRAESEIARLLQQKDIDNQTKKALQAMSSEVDRRQRLR